MCGRSGDVSSVPKCLFVNAEAFLFWVMNLGVSVSEGWLVMRSRSGGVRVFGDLSGGTWVGEADLGDGAEQAGHFGDLAPWYLVGELRCLYNSVF